MREIKFRAWDTEERKMKNISYMFWNTGEWYISRFELDEKEVKDGMPIMQFTGLKDKNGKEIYGGDIFQFGTKKEWINGEGERGIVEWHEKLARFGLTFYSIYGGEGYTGKNQHLVDFIRGLKIIGNIYENPGLLKKK